MDKIPVMKPYFDEAEEKAVIHTIRSGWVAQGSVVEKFEIEIAKHENAAFAVATSSCTSALHLAMKVAGMKRGMDVMVPSFTFVATANAVVETGATPILVDICQDTYNIDMVNVLDKIKGNYVYKNTKWINKNTGNLLWGIIPVHQFGLCADMNAVNKTASDYHLQIIEDAACALGAKIESLHEGEFGNISCISFHPRKSITTGEGGMILTNNVDYVKKMRELRNHGSTMSADKRHQMAGFLLPAISVAGYNYRMSDIQAAIGLEQVKKLDYILEFRHKLAIRYNALIHKIVPELIPPYCPDNYTHTFQSYVCRLNEKILPFDSLEEAGIFRNKLLEMLGNMGIATRQGTHAIHLLSYYANTYGYQPMDLPNAYACDRMTITLPLYVQMNNEQQEYIIHSIRKCLDSIPGINNNRANNRQRGID